MEASKKSRKWRFRKAKKIGPHSSKYQKDYQNNTHGPAKTHINTAEHSSTEHINTAVHINTATQHIVHSTTHEHSSMHIPHHLAMDAVMWPSVTPGGHSVSVQNRTNLSNRADNGESRVPAGPLPLILNRNL